MGRPRKKAVGLGDTVESILKATHIDKMAKWVLGEDCGCEERKQKLNELFRYKRPLCLQEDEYKWLKDYFALNKNTVLPSEQATILKTYNRIFQQRNEPTSCGPCLLEWVNELKEVVWVYEEEFNENTN
jgi:hypothetical protein